MYMVMGLAALAPAQRAHILYCLGYVLTPIKTVDSTDVYKNSG